MGLGRRGLVGMSSTYVLSTPLLGWAPGGVGGYGREGKGREG